MLEDWLVSAGLRLNELAKFDAGAGVILLALKDAGKKAQGITYAELRGALRNHLGPRLERYGIAAPERIVDAVLDYLTEYQSVFTMAAR